MRIISQRRDVSIEFDKAIIKIECETIIRAFLHSDMDKMVLLGVYDTPERAQEVFNDIHNAYAPVGIISMNLSEEQAAQFIGSQNVKMKHIAMDIPDAVISTYDNYVYYMPEE